MIALFSLNLLLLFIHGLCAMEATANLKLDNTNTTIGMLTFYQSDMVSPVKIMGMLRNLNKTSSHGFHVHTMGVNEMSPNCTAAAGHFNPYNTPHGSQTNSLLQRHVGDLGNLTTNENGEVYVNITDGIIDLYNATRSIVNRTIIVHLSFDDGGNGVGDSNMTGNAGARVACGRIILSSNGFNVIPNLQIIFVSILCTAMMIGKRF